MEATNQTGAKRPGMGGTPAGYVAEVDYILTLLSERNARFDAEMQSQSALMSSANESLRTLITSLKESTRQRFDEADLRYEQRFSEVDLRYQQRFDQQKVALNDAAVAADKAVSAALESAEKAVAKAETANEKRFDSVNEFRAQLRDQAGTFIPRLEAEQRLSQIAARLEELRTTDAQRTGRSAGSSSIYGWIIAGLGGLATIVVIAATLLR